MWYLILFIIVLAAYLLEAVFSLPFLLIFVVAQSSFDDIKTASIFAFLAGVLSDIGNVRPLGTGALLFLIISLVVQIYRRRFQEESVGFLFIATLLFVHIYFWIFDKGSIIYPIPAFVGAILVIVITGILFWLKPVK